MQQDNTQQFVDFAAAYIGYVRLINKIQTYSFGGKAVGKRRTLMKMTYGINDKVPMKKAVPLALQHVFTIFTGTIAGSTMLATGAGLDINGTAIIIQCGMLCCAIASLIQCLGLGKLNIGSKLPIITAGSYTLIGPMVVLANNPEIGIAGAFGAAFAGSILLFIFGPLAIK